VIVGTTSRAQIESFDSAWRDALENARFDEATARELASVPPGAEVDVYFGTWCSDSRREVSRLLRALELAPDAPFTIRWIGVDRARAAPGLTEGAELRFVPTFVVRRDGVEVGRIIESAPHGIERDLLELLTGRASGVVSGRDDL
jgi:hypothetical protein